MAALFFSIFFTTLVFLILKEFNRFAIDNLQAIVVSYFVALLIGCVFSGINSVQTFLEIKSWFFGAISISVVFIIVFNLMAVTAQKGGLSVMTIANKMSVVIPIFLGVILYNEKVGFLKIIGILIALLAVWFSSQKKQEKKLNKRFWYLPLFIFIGSGLADSLLNHMQTFYVSDDELSVFSTSLFLFCGLIGVLVIIVKVVLKKITFSYKNILGGLVLGIPNYFSIYFLLKALSDSKDQTALVFSLNNLLVVFCSVALGVFFYKEKLNVKNYIGIVLSVVAIIILYYAT